MKNYVRPHMRMHTINDPILKREVIKGTLIEHDEHPEFHKKTAMMIATDHLKKDPNYYKKEQLKKKITTAEKKVAAFVGREYDSFKNWLAKKKEQRDAQAAIKKELGTKLETYN